MKLFRIWSFMRGFHKNLMKFHKNLMKNHGKNRWNEDNPAVVFYDYAKPFFETDFKKKHDTCLFFSFSIFNVPF